MLSRLKLLPPNSAPEIPAIVVNYIARLVEVSPEEYCNYDWLGRTGWHHRRQIRAFCGFRRATVADARQLVEWLTLEHLPHSVEFKYLENVVLEHLIQLRIEPMTPGRMERLIRSAVRRSETNFFTTTHSQLPAETCTAIDDLLRTAETADAELTPDLTNTVSSTFHFLNADPGRVSLDSLLQEIAKLKHLRFLGLPANLFKNISQKVLQTYRTRAATEPPRELRGHPEHIRYTLMAAWGYQRSQEVTDNLVDLLTQIVHKLSSNAERRVTAELTEDFKRVTGKNNILFRIANATLEQPGGIVKDVIYPVASEQTLKDLVKEFKSTGTTYRQKVHTVIRSSYSNHYRRMVPQILEVLKFRSNNEVHRPVIQALDLLMKYAGSRKRYYDPDDEVPIDGVLKSGWREVLLEMDDSGNERGSIVLTTRLASYKL